MLVVQRFASFPAVQPPGWHQSSLQARFHHSLLFALSAATVETARDEAYHLRSLTHDLWGPPELTLGQGHRNCYGRKNVVRSLEQKTILLCEDYCSSLRRQR